MSKKRKINKKTQVAKHESNCDLLERNLKIFSYSNPNELSKNRLIDSRVIGVCDRLSLGTAAKLVAKNPSTLTRNANSGELDYKKDSKGKRTFGVLDLVGLYGPLNHLDKNTGERATKGLSKQSGSFSIDLSLLSQRVTRMEKFLSEKFPEQ